MDTPDARGYIDDRDPMRILIANKDRTEDLGPRLAAAAAGRPDRLHGSGRMPEPTALSLGEARTEDEFLRMFIEHLRRQHGRFAEGYDDIGGRPGLAGRVRGLARNAVARLTRAEQERVLARQGLLTELLLAAMEFQQARHQRDVDQLNQRLDALQDKHGPDTGSEPGP